MRTRKKNKSRFLACMTVVAVLGSLFTGSITSHAAVGNILDYADTPSPGDVASSKYAVIAKFTSETERIITGASTRRTTHGKDFIVEPSASQKGEIKVLYTNVGTYKGRTLNFEFVVTDWEKAGFEGGEYFHFYDTHIGFKQGGYDSVTLEATYKYADTGKPATDLTGSYMTVNDFDARQYMAFSPDMRSKIDKIYAYDGSWVNYWHANGKTNIGSKASVALDSDDRRGIITMLVSGYTFDFAWSKDWSGYNKNQVIDWYNEQYGQYFAYISEKPVRTEVLEPTKKILNANGNQVDSNNATVSDSYTYAIYHTVPSEYAKFYYDNYVIRDTVHGALDIERVRVYDTTGDNVTYKFDISTSGNRVRAEAESRYLNSSGFYGQDYRLEIDVEVEAGSDLLDYANGDNVFYAYNTASVTVDGDSESTNRVRTKITLPHTELGMKHIQIYTDKANNGLPVNLKVRHTNKYEMYENMRFTISLYRVNGSARDLMAQTRMQLEDIPSVIDMQIPSSELNQDDQATYEAVITDYDSDFIHVASSANSINTDGYTSTEGVLTARDSRPVEFTGVVMTEREIGHDMNEYHESITIERKSRQTVKSGYGFELYGKVTYTNEIMSDITRKFDINRTTDTVMTVDTGLVDKSLSFYNVNSDTIDVNLLRKSESNRSKSSVVTYQAPHIYLEQESGLTYTEQQKDNGAIEGQAIDGGNELYVPVWIENLGEYDLVLKSKQDIGSHHMDFQVKGVVDVTAYMFSHFDSDTPELDELLIHPMSLGDSDFSW